MLGGVRDVNQAKQGYIARMKKICSECKKPFIDPDEWRSSCIICWKKSKSYTLTKSDTAFEELQDYTAELEKDSEKAHKRIVKLEKKLAEAEDKLVEAEIGEKENSGNTDLTEKQLKALLRLCHPDKHSNSELSNEVTKWLLKMRK